MTTIKYLSMYVYQHIIKQNSGTETSQFILLQSLTIYLAMLLLLLLGMVVVKMLVVKVVEVVVPVVVVVVLYKQHRRVVRFQCAFNNLICIRKPACDTSPLHLIQTELNSTSLIKLSAIDWIYHINPFLSPLFLQISL